MKQRVFLIGGFEESVFLAQSLIKQGYAVTAINDSMEKCQMLAAISHLLVFNGDGSNPEVLEQADIYNADIAMALTDRDDDNFVIAELCKKKYEVKYTISLVSDPKLIDFFKRMDVDVVISAVSTIASILEGYVTGTQWTS
jgi:trk system potassium uptake protein TrkA